VLGGALVGDPEIEIREVLPAEYEDTGEAVPQTAVIPVVIRRFGCGPLNFVAH
jgi:hypothetical protein